MFLVLCHLCPNNKNIITEINFNTYQFVVNESIKAILFILLTYQFVVNESIKAILFILLTSTLIPDSLAKTVLLICL